MIKQFAGVAASLGLLMGVSNAATVYGPFNDNDNETNVSAALGFPVSLVGKIECEQDNEASDPDGCQTPELVDALAGATFTLSNLDIDDNEAKSGTLTFDLPDGWVLQAYVLKAKDFVAISLMPPSNAGSFAWSMHDDLDGKGLSHMSFYATQEIPVPAAALLFPAGLAAVAWRKKKRA